MRQVMGCEMTKPWRSGHRRILTSCTAVLVGTLAMGCSNAPLAGTLDCLFPSQVRGGGGSGVPRPPQELFDPSRNPSEEDREPIFPRLRREPGRPGEEVLPRIGEPFMPGGVSRSLDRESNRNEEEPLVSTPTSPPPPLRSTEPDDDEPRGRGQLRER